MKDLENKSNNELMFEIKQLQADFESLKLKILKDYDKLEEIEKTYLKINNILLKRMNGEL
jgi:hypothetical protein